MPRCDATFDENAPPLHKGGLQGGFERGNSPTPALRATPPTEGIFKCHSHDLLTASFDAGQSLHLVLPKHLFVELHSQPGPRRNSDLPLLNPKLWLDDVLDVISRSSYVGSIDFKIKSLADAGHLHDRRVANAELPIGTQRGTDPHGSGNLNSLECRTDASRFTHIQVHRVGCSETGCRRDIVGRPNAFIQENRNSRMGSQLRNLVQVPFLQRLFNRPNSHFFQGRQSAGVPLPSSTLRLRRRRGISSHPAPSGQQPPFPDPLSIRFQP